MWHARTVRARQTRRKRRSLRKERMRRAPIPKPVQIPAPIHGRIHARIQQAAHTRLLQVMIAPLRVAQMTAWPAAMIAQVVAKRILAQHQSVARQPVRIVRAAQEVARIARHVLQAILTAAAHKPVRAVPQASRRFTARSLAREQTPVRVLTRAQNAAQAQSVVQARSAAPIPRHIPAQNTEAVQRAAASLNRAR